MPRLVRQAIVEARAALTCLPVLRSSCGRGLFLSPVDRGRGVERSSTEWGSTLGRKVRRCLRPVPILCPPAAAARWFPHSVSASPRHLSPLRRERKGAWLRSANVRKDGGQRTSREAQPLHENCTRLRKTSSNPPNHFLAGLRDRRHAQASKTPLVPALSAALRRLVAG